APDCVEDGEEQRMQFVFNRGDHADSNGFADADETELRRALVVRLASHTEQPAERTFAREFRYDGGRQRYLVRELEPVTFDAVSEVWSDYLGDDVYADYEVGEVGAVTELTSYLAGHWQTDAQTAASTFFHVNHLGTTRALTDGAGALVSGSARLYTAFGEVVTPPTIEATRYGFAGTWGYEGGAKLWGDGASVPNFLHVGARYYSPSLGRFLQRDPIGIAGGLNVFAYVHSNPAGRADPSGLFDGEKAIVSGACAAFLAAITAAAMGPVGAAAVLGGVAGGYESGDFRRAQKGIRDAVDAMNRPIYGGIRGAQRCFDDAWDGLKRGIESLPGGPRAPFAPKNWTPGKLDSLDGKSSSGSCSDCATV
ncbi:MAG: RHS repeat-associated core domain-containing protein, partial [bacterium]|nr:RHS repeat-associated core domain-containing protein [bacterium]